MYSQVKELSLIMQKRKCKEDCPVQAGWCYCEDPKVTDDDRKKLARQVKKINSN